MYFFFSELLLVSLFFGAYLVLVYLGRGLALYVFKNKTPTATVLFSEKAVFSIMALLLAFSFSGASTRLDQRRLLVVTEANTILATYLEAKRLPPVENAVIRNDILHYLDLRQHFYESIGNYERMEGARQEILLLQKKIWDYTKVACSVKMPNANCNMLFRYIESMMQLENERYARLFYHPPHVIYFLLLLLTVINSILAGYSMPLQDKSNQLSIFIYSSTLAILLLLILNIEYPHMLGFNTSLDQFDGAMKELSQRLQWL